MQVTATGSAYDARSMQVHSTLRPPSANQLPEIRRGAARRTHMGERFRCQLRALDLSECALAIALTRSMVLTQ